MANINGYWNPFLTLIEHMRAQKFLPATSYVDCLVANRVEEILPKLQQATRDVSEAEKTMAVPAERM